MITIIGRILAGGGYVSPVGATDATSGRY